MFCYNTKSVIVFLRVKQQISLIIKRKYDGIISFMQVNFKNIYCI